jgi:N-acetylmuramoyl-L-alanine amidase
MLVGVAALAVDLTLQSQAPSLTVLSREGRRGLALTVVNGQEFVALDDLAAAFQLAVREASGAVTVTYKARTIVLPPDQALASISGRLVALPSRPMRTGGRWSVPVEFVSRALALVYDARLDLRRTSHLLLVGDVRVPRVTVRHDPLGSAARLTIDATPRAPSSVVQEGGRVVVRFEADALDVVPPVMSPQGIINGVRVDGLALGIELGPRFASFRSTTETLDNTTRLILDFTARAADPSAAPAAPATPPAPEIPSLNQPAPPISTMVIDPGHGGADAGARGARGTLEKDVTLAVARKLKAALEGRLGIRVILTRDDDRHVPLDERSAVANNNKAGLFVSLHANASVRPAVQGASLVVAGLSDADRTRTPAAAVRLPVFGGGLRAIELVPWDVAQLGFIRRSDEAARLIAVELQRSVPVAEPAVIHAPFRVIESANMPAVVIELGYLSNPDQEAQLATGEFQTTVAQAIMEAVVRFRDYLGGGGER